MENLEFHTEKLHIKYEFDPFSKCGTLEAAQVNSIHYSEYFFLPNKTHQHHLI